MMRINSGIFCALAMTLAFACADSSSGDDDGSGSGSGSNVMSGCGDGVCSPSEVGFCTSDCGNGGSGAASCGNGMCETTKGENGTSCPADCGGGSGSGSGSGSGTSTLNCSDPNTQIGCLLCTGLQMCTAPYDATSCAACGGMGSGSGFGDLLCTGGAPDGTCDSMESNQTCPSDCP